MLEKTIQGNILDYLNSLPLCVAENVHGNAYQRGRPDINACWGGRLLRIEVKTSDHGNTPTELQKENLKKWSQSGAICFVAYSLEEVKWVVRKDGIMCNTPEACLSCPVNKKYCYSKRGLKNVNT